MSNLFLGLLTLAFIVGVIIFILVMLELRKTIRALKEFIDTTEHSLTPTIIELRETLGRVKDLANSAMVVTEDIKIFSGALKDAGGSVKRVSGDVEHVVNLVEGISSLAAVEVPSFKAGVKVGFGFLLKNLFKKNCKSVD